ncbi:MAG: hypothetical protein HYX35_04645 [Proteobacteria bacterium]|nr:hypothetical protein [Pseudomonadota bacterium]
MKKTIFTLLATASLLATTPILAMDDEIISTLTSKPRPSITDTPKELADSVIVDDFETHGSIVATLSTGKKGVFKYDKEHGIEPATLIDAIRSNKVLWVCLPDYSDEMIRFQVHFDGHIRELYFDIEQEATKSPTYKNPLLLDNWKKLGLLKTNPLPVKEGQKLTVTCKFAAATEDTAIDFINTAQNAYYPGGVIVKKGETEATFTSFVPKGETQTWLVLRNPAFNGTAELPLGVGISAISINVE